MKRIFRDVVQLKCKKQLNESECYVIGVQSGHHQEESSSAFARPFLLHTPLLKLLDRVGKDQDGPLIAPTGLAVAWAQDVGADDLSGKSTVL